MAMPLTGRNLSICSSCNACISGGQCKYAYREVKIKFANPIKIRTPRISKPKRIKVPEEIKFITLARRVQAKTKRMIALGIINKPNFCQRCGMIGKIDTHHPDYNNPDLLEFLCRSCHIKERSGNCTTTIELHEIAKQRRLRIIEEKWGTQIKNILMDFHNQPELKASDLADLMGLSRERVRQFLIQIHGRASSPTITNKCKSIKTKKLYIERALSKLLILGLKPKRTHHSEFLIRNNVLIAIKKICYHKSFGGLFVHNYFKSPLQIIIGVYNNTTYILPLKKLGRPTYYFKMAELPQYKEAWHLLKLLK